MMDVSVVIPTYRRPELLSRCLTALLAQDYDPARLEIIVADDAAEKETEKIVSEFAATTPIALQYVPVTGKHGPAAARNSGWRRARGRVIAFTDDDTIPEADWIKHGLLGLRHGAVAVSGKIVVPLPEKPTDYERDTAGLASAEFATANCFVLRHALEEIGGLDERFTSAWREDSDLHFSLLTRYNRPDGWPPVDHVPDAVVIHPVRPSSWGTCLRQQRKSVFNALLYKKHQRLYRRHIQALPPWHYYFTVTALLTGIAGTLLGNPSISQKGWGTWAALSLAFTAYRLRNTRRSPDHLAEILVTSALIPPLSIYWRLRGAFRYRVLFL